MDALPLDRALAVAPVAMLVADVTGNGLACSERFASLVGGDALGEAWLDALAHGDRAVVEATVARVVATGSPAKVRCRLAPLQWVELELAPSRGDDGAVAGVVAVVTVILDDPLLAGLDDRTDPLTGAANRFGLIAYLETSLAPTTLDIERPVSAGLLVVDLDGFHEVNERMGTAAGDALLGAVVGRMRGAVRFCDLVARIDGDRFAVVTEQEDDPAAIARVATRVLRALDRPFRLDNGNVHLTASAGIAVGDGALGAESLLALAGEAMLAAKAAGGGCFRQATGLRLLS